ncbi:hypothetical protein T484DRAFT_1797310 [Baffinella frigidus]|nr:hypothetical protein T484DRAFT_1797310 [Cryptophyta sp. CCMP2293]
MERYSLSPPSTPEGAAPPEMVPGSSGKLLRAKNKIMSALNRAKTAQRQLDKGAQSRREEKLDELQPAGFSALDTKLKLQVEHIHQLEQQNETDREAAARDLKAAKDDAKRYRETAERELAELRRKVKAGRLEMQRSGSVKAGRLEMQRSGSVQMELFLTIKDMAEQARIRGKPIAVLSTQFKDQIDAVRKSVLQKVVAQAAILAGEREQTSVAQKEVEHAASLAGEREQFRRELRQGDDDVHRLVNARVTGHADAEARRLQLELAALAEAALQYHATP